MMAYVRTRINLLGTWIDDVDLEEAGRRIEAFILEGTPRQVVPANLDFLRLCHHDKGFRKLINQASLVVPDGMPLLWASRVLGHSLRQRIAGVDLMLECARLAAERSYRIYLLGAEPGVADRTASILREAFPGLSIVGTAAPSRLPLSATDEKMTLALIKSYRPDILFVAFGAPLQEQWIQNHIQDLDVPVCCGVGGAFDMISGRVSRAPGWMQQRGMEWFYRFLLEPRRLWKRYFVHDLPVFLRLLARSALSDTSRHLSTSVVCGPESRVPHDLEERLVSSSLEAEASLIELHG
ncbi:MAG TPA: WecB/TagA/CpsF family glycosyltransferase [Chloroflexota bacterium]|nr:WecB/TagA/CpsF family glycosyltransferase [Chloroflexota bacterium]